MPSEDAQSAKAPRKRLRAVATSLHLGNPETISNIALRKVVTWSTVLLFFTVNLSIVALLFYLGWADHAAAQTALANPNAPRDVLAEVIAHPLITPGVLMSLIGGSVVELGVVMVLIAKYLFPHPAEPRRRESRRAAAVV